MFVDVGTCIEDTCIGVNLIFLIEQIFDSQVNLQRFGDLLLRIFQ